MAGEQGVCRECGGEVPMDATRCRHCGFNPRSHNKWRWGLGIIGLLLTMTIIGAVVGIPLLWKAYKHRKAYERGVAKPA